MDIANMDLEAFNQQINVSMREWSKLLKIKEEDGIIEVMKRGQLRGRIRTSFYYFSLLLAEKVKEEEEIEDIQINGLTSSILLSVVETIRSKGLRFEEIKERSRFLAKNLARAMSLTEEELDIEISRTQERLARLGRLAGG